MTRAITMSRTAVQTTALALIILATCIAVLPTTVHAAALPRVTAVQSVQAGGLEVWRVSFDNGASCDVQRPLSAALGGQKAPTVGATMAFSDGRIVLAGLRIGGDVQFTDAAGVRHVGY